MSRTAGATVFKAETMDRAQLQDVAEAARLGKVIAFPTDTVYGLGSSAFDEAAIKRIYRIKGRPEGKPLPLLVHSIDAARPWMEWNRAAEALSRRFWPGGLTLILRSSVEGRRLPFSPDTLAVRVPNHPLLQKTIELSGCPWASTSANRSGAPALVEGTQVVASFEGLVDYIIDGKRAPGTESTLVDATRTPAAVLRSGCISLSRINEVLSHG
ncbi:MAG: threonylcarbamoyl-AMP synthase [Elusimicrobia bacterium]|nr:threonylcarbamoyl-AMP synthase [Elusimicrobiota bacterium]